MLRHRNLSNKNFDQKIHTLIYETRRTSLKNYMKMARYFRNFFIQIALFLFQKPCLFPPRHIIRRRWRNQSSRLQPGKTTGNYKVVFKPTLKSAFAKVFALAVFLQTEVLIPWKCALIGLMRTNKFWNSCRKFPHSGINVTIHIWIIDKLSINSKNCIRMESSIMYHK